MTIAVDLGHKATKPTKNLHGLSVLSLHSLSVLSLHGLFV